ncbi:MAG: flagellin [Thermoproteota archaeon]|jgi:flagellin
MSVDSQIVSTEGTVMGFRINTNVSSISAQRALTKTNQSSQKSLTQMSSGSRIVTASDDAAGMAISEKLKANIRSLGQANRNANDGISMIQVAEGGLNETQSILTRLRELSIQAASDTVGDSERKFSDLEYQNLKEEMQRISEVTEFNGTKLLNGDGDKLDFQIGINNDDFQDRISYNVQDTNSSLESLGLGGIDVMSKVGAQGSLDNIDSAIEKVSGQRSQLGALQNRLTSTSNNLQTTSENLSAANSRIRDVDYAEATAQNAKNNILAQAGTSVLAQANAAGQGALRLIG